MLAGATYRNIANPAVLPLNAKEISGPPFPTMQICKPGQNSRRVPRTRNHNFLLTLIAFDCDVRSATNTLHHSFGAQIFCLLISKLNRIAVRNPSALEGTLRK